MYCNLSLAWTTKVFSILFLEQATLIFPSHFEGQNSYSSTSNHHWRICCVRVALSRQGSSTQRPNTLRNITRGCTEMDSSFANHSWKQSKWNPVLSTPTRPRSKLLISLAATENNYWMRANSQSHAVGPLSSWQWKLKRKYCVTTPVYQITCLMNYHDNS